MKPGELQAILQDPKKLSPQEIKRIIRMLINDCLDEIYKLQTMDSPNIVKMEQGGATIFKAVLQNIGSEQFYTGESYGLHICLDLLNKLEVE